MIIRPGRTVLNGGADVMLIWYGAYGWGYGEAPEITAVPSQRVVTVEAENRTAIISTTKGNVMAGIFLKDPDAALEWAFDWSQWLVAGDTLRSADVFANGVTAGLTALDDTTVTTWVTGGVAGARAEITCRVTTMQDRTDDRTITLIILER